MQHHHPTGHSRHIRRGIARRYRRHRRRGKSGFAAALAVLGPGILAGLSDDDPAGITTYSILGAQFGYSLLWVLAAATCVLIVFHMLALRLGVVTGKGFTAVIRERFGRHWAGTFAMLLVGANFGTICAEYAGIAAVASLAGIPPALVVIPSSIILSIVSFG